MRKLLFVVVVTGCWTSSSTAPPPQTPIEHTPRTQAAASTGGQGYGGTTYGTFTVLPDDPSGFDDMKIYGGLLGADPQGSVGLGGGGASGSGYGRLGGGLGGRSNSPTVNVGQQTTASPALDKAIIRRYIKRNLLKIRYCYEKELVNAPDLAGTVTAKFTIDANGNVSSATASGVNASLESCIAGVIRAIQFPKPHGGSSVHVSYPFTFSPAQP